MPGYWIDFGKAQPAKAIAAARKRATPIRFTRFSPNPIPISFILIADVSHQYIGKFAELADACVVEESQENLSDSAQSMTEGRLCGPPGVSWPLATGLHGLYSYLPDL